MTSARRVGRVVGALLLAQGVIAPIVNFRLLGRASAPPGFLVNGAAHATEVRIAVLLWSLTGALSLAVAIVALPLFRERSERLAFLYLSLSAIGCTTLTTENIALLNMLGVSLEYAKASGAREIFEALDATTRSARFAAHFMNLFVGGITGIVFYVICFRFALVPRIIAGFGLPAFALQTLAVTMPLLGFPFQFWTLTPIGLTQLALVGWLLTKGFRPTASERP
jgi:hypothetical protein